ncbi:MAG TPA: primosomal protein N', partial [Niabella sp.]|nr:primosomal protein N' [Niabella sp.]
DEEINKRQQFEYPPFNRIIKLTLKHKMKDVVQDAAVIFASTLQNRYRRFITGPSEPIINRVRNQYLMEMLLKLPRNKKLIEQCKKDILFQVAVLHNEKRYRSVVVVPDVDTI